MQGLDSCTVLAFSAKGLWTLKASMPVGTQKIREQWKTGRLEKDLYQNQERDISCIFLNLEAKTCLFPEHSGSKSGGLKADGHGVASLVSLERNSLGTNIPALNINISGIFIVLCHPRFYFFPVVCITEPRGRNELFDGDALFCIYYFICFCYSLHIDRELLCSWHCANTNRSLDIMPIVHAFVNLIGKIDIN